MTGGTTWWCSPPRTFSTEGRTPSRSYVELLKFFPILFKFGIFSLQKKFIFIFNFLTQFLLYTDFQFSFFFCNFFSYEFIIFLLFIFESFDLFL